MSDTPSKTDRPTRDSSAELGPARPLAPEAAENARVPEESGEPETPHAAEHMEAEPIDPDSPERRELEAAPSSRCLNCQAELPGDYCPACGQKDQPLRQPVHRYLVEALSEYLGLDGRVWPTLRALLFKPGRLTKAYVLGRRQEYVRPLRIYISASLLFFFLLALIDPVGKIRQTVNDGMAMDTTMTAAAYLRTLDESRRAEAEADAGRAAERDSLRALTSGADAAILDSLRALDPDDLDSLALATFGGDATRLTPDDLESAREDLDDVLRDIRRDSLNTDDRREAWAYEYVEALPPDASIRPVDIQNASELLIADPGSGFNGPNLGIASGPFQRLQDARTTQAQVDAGWELGRLAIGRIPTVVFLLLPLFALFMKVLYVRRGWYYAEHLVFALHVHAFAFVVFSVYAVLIWASGAAPWSVILGGVLLLTIPLYFVLAQKAVYAQGWAITLVKTYFLSWLYSTAIFFGAILAVILAAAVG